MADNSNVEPVERQESNRTEHNSIVERGKHKRKPCPTSKFDDYGQGSPSPGTVSKGVASLENDEEKKQPSSSPIEFEDFLDKLYRPLNDLTRQQEPPSVSHWNEDCNDKMVRHYFKMKRCTVTPEAFVARYLFGGPVQLYKLMKMRSGAEMEPILDYLDQSTSYIDFTENNLFLSSDFPDEQSKWANRITVSNFISSLSQETENFSHLLHGVPLKLCRKMVKHFETRISDWVDKLAFTVKFHPSVVPESEYADIFKMYLQLFNWECHRGNTFKLNIPYRDKRVVSEPDIIARRKGMSQYSAIVEVKNMTLDPTLKHASLNKGILVNSNEGVKPPKMKRVDFQSEEASTVEQSEEKDSDVEDEHPLEPGESPVSKSQRKFIKLFFGQLFGSVLALDRCFPQNLDDLLPRLGIGVVGYRVVFFTFCVEPACQLKDITQDANSRMKVHMTSELSLLKASDRRKINEILLPLSGCSKVYNISLHPQLKSINSQVAEQRNAQIEPLSSMLSHMKRKNFVFALRLHLGFRNCLHMAKYFPDREFQYKDYFLKRASLYR